MKAKPRKRKTRKMKLNHNLRKTKRIKSEIVDLKARLDECYRLANNILIHVTEMKKESIGVMKMPWYARLIALFRSRESKGIK